MKTFAGLPFAGKVLTGGTPVIGATMQIYAMGATGNGSTATTLLGGNITTDGGGNFTIGGGYPCPVSGSVLYVTATGGKPGAASATNPAIGLMTAIGPCGGVTGNPQFTLNELTTVAAAYALAPFGSSTANVGASATNTQGVANALATAASLVNPANGSAPGATFPANGAYPAARINSVANLLNACVNATAPGGQSSACTQLFSATSVNGSTAPANTRDAVMSLVHAPANNVAQLFALAQSSKAYTPALTAAPADWTLAINFTGGGMNSPSALGVDGKGNVWVASYFGAATQFSPTGSLLTPKGVTGNGLSDSYGLAIDVQGSAWITNEQSPYNINGGLGTVTVINSSGAAVSGTNGYAAGGLNYPISIAIDTNATAWVVDYGNSHLTLLSGNGQPVSGDVGYTTPLFAFPVAVAIDANHTAWIANQSDTTITHVTPDGKQFTNVSCCDGASGLAVDQKGNIWVANYYGNSISEVANSGTVISSGYTGGGINHPQGIAIDGNGNVWVSNFRGPSLTELAGASGGTPGATLSPAAGWASDAGLLEAYAIAVDASGNLWVSNFGNNTLTEFVGMAAPVKTPLLGPPQAP